MNISRKKILIMSITILMMILLSRIFGYATNNFAPKLGVTTERINFRKTANLDSSSVIRTIPQNTKLQVVGQMDNFYISILENKEVGLVSTDYTNIQESNSDNTTGYQTLDKFMATVIDNGTNLRGGPGTNFASYARLLSGTQVQVIGKIDNWYLVTTQNNTVGMVREDLIKTNEQNGSTDDGNNGNTTPTLPNTAETILELINQARKNAGVTQLQVDSLLNSTSQAKANDMVKNNYFSHTSPTYGTPFQMMKNAGITYRTAGENIAGNPSVESAVNSWLNSETHRQNILSNAYNYIGIGIEPSDAYGYVIVVMFIGR